MVMVIGSTSARPPFAGFGAVADRGFRVRVENHIQDVEQGRGRESAGVAFELEARHEETSDFLAQSHPEALSQYLGLLSGFGYAERARIAASMSQFSRGLQAFEKAHAQSAYAKQNQGG